jgi:predicted nucleic acid-binding Zn ribbon protein
VKRKCPDCGKLKLKRLIGIGSGVIFKGSGFYQTDYRSDSYKKAAEADKKSSEPTTSKKDGKKTKSESKPDKKSDSGSSKSSD